MTSTIGAQGLPDLLGAFPEVLDRLVDGIRQVVHFGSERPAPGGDSR